MNFRIPCLVPPNDLCVGCRPRAWHQLMCTGCRPRGCFPESHKQLHRCSIFLASFSFSPSLPSPTIPCVLRMCARVCFCRLAAMQLLGSQSIVLLVMCCVHFFYAQFSRGHVFRSYAQKFNRISDLSLLRSPSPPLILLPPFHVCVCVCRLAAMQLLGYVACMLCVFARRNEKYVFHLF